MAIHDEVLAAAQQIASGSENGTFTPAEVVEALPHLNESSVRTHVTSRCCVNAPKNHDSRLPYFRRVAHGIYKIEPDYK